MASPPPPPQPLAALTSCLAAVPPSAVSAVVDCVVASSSLLPSHLFSSLLHSFPDPSKRGSQSNYAVSHAAALCHLIQQSDCPNDALRLVLWRVFLPLLKEIDRNELELLEQVMGLMCDAVSKNQSWELLGETLVPFCVRSIGIAMGLVRGDKLVVYQWDAENFVDGEFDGKVLGLLPLLKASTVLALLLSAALRRRRELRSSGQVMAQGYGALDCLVQNLAWDLSKLVLRMFTQGPEYQFCATRILLQPLLISLDDLSRVTVHFDAVQYKLSRFSFLEMIWKCCFSLFSLGHMERRDAYDILSVYFSSTVKSRNEDVVLDGRDAKDFDLCNVREFWDELRKGLVDKDSLVRKQALYILKVSLSLYSSYSGNDGSQWCSDADDSSSAMHVGAESDTTVTKRERWAKKEAKSLGVGEAFQTGEHCSNGKDQWKVFLLLYEMLQEYGTHLVEAAWTHQVLLLFESTPQNNFFNLATPTPYHAQMETSEGIFQWMAVLWERGFTHDNPQVRCLVMQSFLDIAWEKYKDCTQFVPRGFVLGPLIRGLNDVIHHKDFGIGGVYTSKTIKGAERFFSMYSEGLITSDRLYLIWSLASAARPDSFGRAGLMTLAFCVASCACQSDACHIKYTTEEKMTKCNGDTLPAIHAADVLDVLRILSERSKQHFNPKYRLKVCEQVLKAAASSISTAEVPFDLLLHFLSTIPREFTDYFGPLRGLIQKWLVQSSDRCSAGTTLLNKLINFPSSFIKRIKVDGSCLFDDADVCAWEAEARRWARALLLITSEEQHLEPIFMFFENYGGNLSEQNLIMEWIPVKLLIIILSLIEELEVRWRKFVWQNDAMSKGGSHSTKGSVCCCPPNSLIEKLANSLLSILGNMVVFGKSVCSIFWSGIVDINLPSSIKGELGGPSQRRLATSVTSSVLEAIWLMRSISSVISWCNNFSSDDSLSSPFLFLWGFCWKVIQYHDYHTEETGAELHLAAYEALAYVLAVLSTAFTSRSIDFVGARQINDEPKPSLDLLASTFLDNVNNLLENGDLTRSRRAVLMCWKWHCVDSLLSIPCNLYKNEPQLKRSDPLFSYTTLRSIFLDIVESLENAGENSVLSILRCARSVLGLLCSGGSNMDSSFSSISSEMMMQLVKSSWILHLSCNKRRVAPIAALLSAILHPAVFPNLEMHETNEKEKGPLKWFIENLLDEGSKSPRTVRLAALHLTGLWLMYPKTLKFYIKELKLLSLYGSVAFDEDFEAELSENHEARVEVSMLAQSPDHEFTEVFINTELYARVSVAVLFNQLLKLIKKDDALKTEESLAALHSGKLFLLELLDSAVQDKDLSKELYKKYSSVHRRKVRVWQMICILSHYVEADIVEEVTSDLHICLYRNNLPAVRQYLETFAIQIYLNFPALAEEQLLPIFYDNRMRPQALSSYVFVAANVILHTSDVAVQIKHLNRLLPPVVPFLTSHHHSLRSFSQLLVHCVLSKLWPAIQLNTSDTTMFEKKCFEDLRKYLAENADCVRLRASIEGFLDVFDPNISATPPGIFSGRAEGSGFECVPFSVMERVVQFLNDVREDLRHSIAKDSITIKNEDLTVANCHDENNDADIVELSQPSKDSLNFQKKITPHKDAQRPMNCHVDSIAREEDISRLLYEMEDDQLFNLAMQSRNQAVERIKQSQQQLIVLASLLDRIPNLAGLARTCEIFKAAGLAIADKCVLQDKQFQLISVTAEKWLPIIEVPVDSVKVFLEKKRLEGYSIVGLEQTANSKPLDQYSFPSKTVLVLGREKEGIPVDVIHILDACVEIPQLGVVRSLNVHVSGAIAVWEYTRQHGLQRS